MEVTKEKSKPCANYRAFSVAAWIILFHEILERFSFYGMKGILTLYMVEFLSIDQNTSTSIYHLFTAVSYLTPIFGAWVSDNYWGRFKTVVVFGALYLVGHTIMPLTALTPNIPGPMISITIIAIGTGMIKPCVAPFGGDQVKGNVDVLDAYFALFYLCINAGSFIAQFVTPILREEKCFGKDCYSLAFGVPAIAFLITYLIFVGFKDIYVYKPTDSKVISNFMRYLVTPKKDIKQRFDKKFLVDVKVAIRVIFLFMPFPIFWALFDQQGSRWTLQARQMDGGGVILPDQMQIVNPLLILAVIPLFNNVIYPILGYFNLFTKAPTRILVGYLFASASFITTGFLQISIDNGLPQAISPGKILVDFYNGYPCTLNLQNVDIKSGVEIQKYMTSNASFELPWNNNGLQLQISSTCFTKNLSVLVDNGKHSRIYLADDSVFAWPLNRSILPLVANMQLILTPKATEMAGGVQNLNMTWTEDGSNVPNFLERQNNSSDWWLSKPFTTKNVGQIKINSTNGMIGLITNSKRANTYTLMAHTDSAQQNTLLDQHLNLQHMLLQLPQYIFMCIGEVLFSVTAMTFAYSEAPESMKALLQSAYLITIFFGNIIVTIVAALPSLPSQAWEFFLFAILVFLAAILQGFIVWRYNIMKNTIEPSDMVDFTFEDKEKRTSTPDITKPSVRKNVEEIALPYTEKENEIDEGVASVSSHDII